MIKITLESITSMLPMIKIILKKIKTTLRNNNNISITSQFEKQLFVLKY